MPQMEAQKEINKSLQKKLDLLESHKGELIQRIKDKDK